MKTKKLTLCAMLSAVGVLAGNIIYIPIGASKCFPVQAAVNVICGVTLGPAYSMLTAFTISLLRNITGMGSIMAFPGSLIGAALASIIYVRTKNLAAAAFGEVFGTGVLGALVAAPISKFILGNEAGALFYVLPFILSSLSGATIGCIILKSTEIIRLRKKFND
ncbi:MAG: energy coupling factor transporter S component ThiW [Firmicutes bacterium]|nr:energy coupling factor transporter S component ThiW [Bacillota bacterium]